MQRLAQVTRLVRRSVLAALIVVVGFLLAYAFGAGYIPVGPVGFILGAAVLAVTGLGRRGASTSQGSALDVPAAPNDAPLLRR